MRLLPRGRVLRATFGCNPNSSSLGVDVTFLLFGATFASALALTLGALLRNRGPENKSGPRDSGGPGSGPGGADTLPAQAASEGAR